MSEDASLDRFEATTGGSEEDAADRTGDTSAGAKEDAADPTEVAPAVSTYEWSPEGGECAACGASVERRWRADGERDGELVCADCKEW